MSGGGVFWATLPLGPGVSLLAHDENGLAALSKPAGVLSHPNSASDQKRSLLAAAYSMDGEYFEWVGSGSGSRQALWFRPPKGHPSEPSLRDSPSARHLRALRSVANLSETLARSATESVSPHADRLWLLNRLDSATSGVILAAANENLAVAIRAQFRRHDIHKTYAALVFGRPRLAEETWRDRLEVKRVGGRIRTTSQAGTAGRAPPAESRMRVVRTGGNLALLQLEPRTGKSHQLRVQCARRGLPVVGDQTYGDFKRNREFAARAGTRRLFLHSLETRFAYVFQGRAFSFAAQAPLPPEFEQW